MKLPVPLIHQKNAKDCGIACIAMVMAYDGKECDYDALMKRYGMLDEHSSGMSLYEIGLYFLEQNYDVTMQTGNVILFNKNQYEMTQPALREHVTWLQESRYPDTYQEGLKSLAAFMDHGGIVKPSIPHEWDLRSEIKNKRPVITSLTNAFMGFGGHGPKRGIGHNMHFATIIGDDYGGFYLNDPGKVYSQGKTQRYSTSEMMFAIHANTAGDVDNGGFLRMSPKLV